MPTPPYQFIAIARTIARGFTEQAIGHPDGEALTEAAQAIWRGIEVLEGMDRRGAEHGPLHASRTPVAVSGAGPRSLIDGATGGGGDAYRRRGPGACSAGTGAARAVSPATLCRLPA